MRAHRSVLATLGRRPGVQPAQFDLGRQRDGVAQHGIRELPHRGHIPFAQRVVLMGRIVADDPHLVRPFADRGREVVRIHERLDPRVERASDVGKLGLQRRFESAPIHHPGRIGVFAVERALGLLECAFSAGWQVVRDAWLRWIGPSRDHEKIVRIRCVRGSEEICYEGFSFCVRHFFSKLRKKSYTKMACWTYRSGTYATDILNIDCAGAQWRHFGENNSKGDVIGAAMRAGT